MDHNEVWKLKIWYSLLVLGVAQLFFFKDILVQQFKREIHKLPISTQFYGLKSIAETHEDTYTHEDLIYRNTSYIWRNPCAQFPKVSYRKTARGELVLGNFFKQDLVPSKSIHLRLDETDLFDCFSGIYHLGIDGLLALPRTDWWNAYGNYSRRGKKAKKRALFGVQKGNYIEKWKSCKIAINGNATRSFPQKSIRVQFIDEPFVNQGELNLGVLTEAFHSFIIRNAGNDWAKSFMRDVLAARLIEQNTSLISQRAELVELYINGNYWGVHWLRDRYDSESIKKRLGNDWLLFDEKDGLDKLPAEISALLHKVCNNEISTNELNEIFEFDNFIEYVLSETYFGNQDWPTGNVKCAILKGASPKVIFLANDFDLAFVYPEYDAFQRLEQDQGITGILWRRYSKIPEFKKKFSDRQRSFIRSISASFENEKSSCYGQLAPLMHRQYNRWRKLTKEQWEVKVAELSFFAKNRERFFNDQITNYLD